MVSASSKYYGFTFIKGNCKKQIIENKVEFYKSEIKGIDGQVEEFIGRNVHNIIYINEAFMAEIEKVISDGVHINNKKYRAEAATLWKARESGTGAM